LKKALFLDRDGIINIDTGHLYLFEDVEYVAGILLVIQEFNNRGYNIVVVTNQAGISKGLYGIKSVEKLHNLMREDILKKTGVEIKDWLFCPHQDSDNCACRKPKIGMILRAQEKYQFDLNSSYLIGDKLSDVEAGISSGVGNCFLLKSEYFDFNTVFNRKNFTRLHNLSELLTY
jgi:D-glycero-D-manno-heptose 1,7-bisphosphate phosphatase|tara:strand:- start:1067 stop:1591 length:525 start_codon:yes stop_codon:yes gene_type:complete